MWKKMTVGKKIVLGFGAVLVLLVGLGVVGFSALSTASEGFTEYRGLARDTNLAGRLQANMLMARMQVKDFLLTSDEKDLKAFDESWNEMRGFMDTAKEEIQDPKRVKLIRESDQLMERYEPAFREAVKNQKVGDRALSQTLNVLGPQVEKQLTKVLLHAEEQKDTAAAQSAAHVLRDFLLARLYVLKYEGSGDVADARRVASELGNAREKLRIAIDSEDHQEIRSGFQQVASGIAEYADGFETLNTAIAQRNRIVEETLDVIGPQFAEKIEDVKLSIKKDQDALGPKLAASNATAVTMILIIGAVALTVGIAMAYVITHGITKPLQQVIDELTNGSEQTTSAATQVAGSSQNLAEGASEQAATLEEISASVEEISSMVTTNADSSKQVAEMAAQNTASATEAATVMASAAQLVNKGQESMGRLNEAVSEIKDQSEQTAKIISTIDEIAFQTNLLALNAAVEAARAGDAGKGFAVVAEEVRNLAQRSAEAARNTSELIEGSLRSAGRGVDVATETSSALDEITESSGKVKTLIDEINAASQEQTRLVQDLSSGGEEQSRGVTQVGESITSMDSVTQANAAAAEECASAAEELSGQAEELNGMVLVLQAMVKKSEQRSSGRSATRSRSEFRVEKQPRPTQSGSGLKRPAVNKGAAAPRKEDADSVIPMDNGDEETLSQF
jgi:methyl-accepting chemotaxis protein